MSKIKIDGKDYDVEALSEEAKAQLTHLASLQYCDQELIRLETQVAVLRTARDVYAKALEATIPKD
jgi:Family of unknown function (DUF6447)